MGCRCGTVAESSAKERSFALRNNDDAEFISAISCDETPGLPHCLKCWGSGSTASRSWKPGVFMCYDSRDFPLPVSDCERKDPEERKASMRGLFPGSRVDRCQ